MVEAMTEKITGAENIVWDLSVYYSSLEDAQITSDLNEVDTMVDAYVADYRGKVAQLEAEELAEAAHRVDAIYERFGRVSNYASLNFAVYSTDPKWGAFLQKVRERSSQFSQKMVFFGLEWNDLPEERAKALLQEPVLRDYAYHLEVQRLNKPYQLSEAEEKILIEKSVTGNGAWVRFFQQLMSGMMLDFKGEKKPMPQVLSALASSENRDERKEAADSISAALQSKQMELTYIFNTVVADKASDDRLRGYPSWITSRNMDNKASDEVVNALINSVTANYELVMQHYRVKRALLGFDELYDYDRYAPLNLKESESFYTWEEAKQICVDAYTAFAPHIGDIARRFFDENWIHAPVMQGKRGGAFASYGTKSTHPWVFVNFTGSAGSVSTLAHELGHGIHMYLAGQKQVPSSMYTPLTTAEMASTFGEMVVFQDLMSKESDKEVQLAMLAGKIEDAFGTIFRQIALNRFEDKLHNTRRTQGELSTTAINALWMEAQTAMYGDTVTLREDYQLWWSYIPHFLSTPGYVYAYSFGELLVFALYTLYQQTGESFVPKFVDLLAAGDSDYPEKLLAQVGINLNDPNFWNQGIATLRELVERETALAKELYPDKF